LLSVRGEDLTLSPIGLLGAMILPGLFGAFPLARLSVDNDGWRFWHWRG